MEKVNAINVDIPSKDLQNYFATLSLSRIAFFVSRVILTRTAQDSLIKIKPGILAVAETITEDQSSFKQIWLNIRKILNV
ncbi:hypothetical protein [Pedobacter sp. V48]|uniref:hypothetical protein n=1 Tax=Pedobacter sp. V48 TaxID=509635 RepID=UPI0003E581EA|nr:hypothetical protein [Pedobacter sp. V48]ETZ23861.1 hypothetical protein N824_15095 [Pedobacter sp. V48]